MNHHGKQINNVLILRRSKDKDSTDTCCVTDADSWSAKNHHWKSEAKDMANQSLNLCGTSIERGVKESVCKMVQVT